MARTVKISIVAPRPASEREEFAASRPRKDFEKAVQHMLTHWTKVFGQVLPDHPDLILVPEVCDAYVNYPLEDKKAYYRFRGDRVRDHFSRIARENHCYVTYSASREMPDGSWRNSLQLLDRNGGVAGVYNKNHVTIGENEEGRLYGRAAPVFECDFGRVGALICFDLNFDELRQKYIRAKPDLLLFSSMFHGGLMQAYWAYACRAYFAAAVCGAPSAVISPVGQTLATTTNYFEYVTAAINLDYVVCHLDYNGARLRAMKQKYGSGVRITDPGFLGSVLVTSETEGLSIHDLVREFELEPLDRYLERSRQHRQGPGRIEPE